MIHKKCSCLKCHEEISTCNIKSHYEKCQTNSCLFCSKLIHSTKKFCNSSCAAKYNNSNRTKEQLQAKAASISKSLSTTYNYVCQLCENEKTTTDRKRKLCEDCSTKISPHRSRKFVNIRNCPKCNIKEISLGCFRHELCPSCRTITEYRGLCNFTHDLRNYPNEYDLILLEEHGMFHPKKNPKGVSRDHMYSVHDGYHNKVDPSILKHPANCSIMLQTNNTIKHSTSSITYEELLERIRIWDEKYN
ncbi:hypothetical protein FDH34_gp435 [Serratia phage BF]|uniref:Uncharacterized protein n=1 Tax=Serratia phage BF TaxID=1962671 RepID=A0A1S6UB99_9CAUD|nr:hypothetical protein FDH34_gp435 [Serratia phage BF]AQW89010.1 hypothetical protein BF_0485 [Serratia phage BF]